jgi:Bacterial SH3 domain
MEAKKTVHITWEDAHRAETERDKARQTGCRSIPPNRWKLATVYVSKDLGKLKAYKQAVTAKMLKEKELAQGFQLRVETATETNVAGTNSQPLRNRHKAETEEAQRTQFGEDELREIYFKRGLTKSAVGIFLAVILLAGVGTMSYSQQSKNYLSHLAVKWGAIAQRAVRHTSDLESMVESSKAQPVALQLSSTNQEPVQPDDRESTAKRPRDYWGNFEVVDNSFVRDNPQPNATVIATLPPGTQLRVESKTGEYFRVRSLHDPEVIGYVHEQDAFFQAH